MKRKNRLLWMMIPVALLVCVTAAAVTAASESIAVEETVKEAETVSMDIDTEKAAETFVNRFMYPDIRLRSNAPKGASLTGGSRNLYMKLREDISAVANGTDGCTGSTIFVYEATEIYPQTSFVAEDLGVASIVSGNSISEEAKTALSTELEKTLNFDTVMDCLRQDCTYELYWYDKTVGSEIQQGFSLSVSHNGTEYVLSFSGQTTIRFTVSQDYAVKTPVLDLYTVDIARYGEAVSKARQKALRIMNAHENESNYDRLKSYKDEICALTEYNHEAADNDNTPYGNPWQLVWVFDENDDTKVVCEGYSKAFWYLNDLSSKTGTDVILAEGTMTGATGEGPHMWNIVQMEDGNNYLIDVTNCDSGSIGNPDLLFMKAPVSGSVAEGYSFDCNGTTVRYVYGENNDSEDRITLCEYGYQDDKPSPWELEITIGTGKIQYYEREAFTVSCSWVSGADTIEIFIVSEADEGNQLSGEWSKDTQTEEDVCEFTINTITDDEDRRLEAGAYSVMVIVSGEGYEPAVFQDGFEIISLPDFTTFVIPENTTEIGAEAFDKIAAQNIMIPDQCTTIGENAFADSSLENIYIPASVTAIGNNALPTGTVVFMPEDNAMATGLRDQEYTVIIIPAGIDVKE